MTKPRGRPGAPCGAAFVLALLAVFPRPAAAQVSAPVGVGVAPEMLELLEVYHLLNRQFLPGHAVGFTFQESLWAVDAAGSSPTAWLDSAASEHFAVGLFLGGRWGEAVLPPGDGFHAGVEGAARFGERWALRTQITGGGEDFPDLVQELTVGMGLGGAVIWGGRAPLRVGPGHDPLLLSGAHPVDGLGVTTRQPAALPGPFRWLGRWEGSLSVGKLSEVGDVENPWLGVMALTLEPTPWLQVGAARTAVFGGDGMPAVNFSRVMGMLLGRHSTDEGEFEDQHAQLFARVRVPTPLGPADTYLSYGANDTEGGIRDSPGLLAGVLIGHEMGGWRAGLRYEFLAYGGRARWCSDCVDRERIWFLHYAYGPHASRGTPLGSSLGGDGARQTLRWSGWSPDGRISLVLQGSLDQREPTNILHSRFPGELATLRFEGGYRLGSEWIVRGAFAHGWGEGDSSVSALELTGSWTAVRHPRFR